MGPVHLRNERAVVSRIDDHRDAGVVLGRTPDHGRPADVDVLHALRETRTPIEGRLERVEVDHQEVDGRDPVLRHGALMPGMPAYGEQTAMHQGMKRLNAPVHHLGEARQLRHVADLVT